MPKGEGLKPFQWKPGESGNPRGKPKKPRRSFDAIQRLQALGVDPLEEAVALAQDPALPKATRLRAWLDLLNYCYPRIGPVMPSETVSARLTELQRSWDAKSWDEFKAAFKTELDALPDATKCDLEKLGAKCGFGPLVMQMLLKFVEQRHEQEQAQDPQDPGQPGLKVVEL